MLARHVSKGHILHAVPGILHIDVLGLSLIHIFTTDEEGHKAVFAPEHKLYSYPSSYKPKPIDSERYKSATHEVLDKLCLLYTSRCV